MIRDNGKNLNTLSYFAIENRTTYLTNTVDGCAFGLGIAIMLATFDWILLGPLPWKQIIGDALNAK